MIKRKVQFQITVGSYLPELDFSAIPHMRDVRLPIGGEEQFITVEFDTDNIKPIEDAFKALAETMKNQTYHVWYWIWLE